MCCSSKPDHLARALLRSMCIKLHVQTHFQLVQRFRRLTRRSSSFCLKATRISPPFLPTLSSRPWCENNTRFISYSLCIIHCVIDFLCLCLQNSALNGVMARGIPGLKEFSLANVYVTHTCICHTYMYLHSTVLTHFSSSVLWSLRLYMESSMWS